MNINTLSRNWNLFSIMNFQKINRIEKIEEELYYPQETFQIFKIITTMNYSNLLTGQNTENTGCWSRGKSFLIQK